MIYTLKSHPLMAQPLKQRTVGSMCVDFKIYSLITVESILKSIIRDKLENFNCVEIKQ